MKRMNLALIIACVILFLSFQPATGSEEWTLVREKNGISTYSSDVPGSTYKAFKSTTIINATMAAVGAVLRDVAEYPKWIDKVSETKILKKHNENDMDVYIIMNFPWPTSDRDATASAKTTIDPETGNVTVTTELFADPAVPPKKGFVRLPKMFQQYILAYKEFDRTEITYSIHLETGGNLKALLVNGQTEKSPHKSLANLKTFVQQKKYASSDPLDPVNIETARTIIKAIAKKSYKDQDIINMLTTDKELMTISIRAGYSDEGINEIANALIKKYLKTDMFISKIENHKDKELLAMAASDDTLVENFSKDHELLKIIQTEGEMNTRVLDAIADRIK